MTTESKTAGRGHDFTGRRVPLGDNNAKKEVSILVEAKSGNSIVCAARREYRQREETAFSTKSRK